MICKHNATLQYYWEKNNPGSPNKVYPSGKILHPFTLSLLTRWGRVTHTCVDKLTIIGSDNGLSPDRRQAIIWTNAGLLSIGSLRTYFNENLIKIQQFSLMKMHVKMSSAKLRPSCPGLNVLKRLMSPPCIATYTTPMAIAVMMFCNWIQNYSECQLM